MASPATIERLQAEFDSPPTAIATVVQLLEEKAPPAFIARYRRWATANMPEERIQAIADRLHFLDEIEQRKQSIRQQAEERGRLTAELEATLANSVDQDLIDDLYQSLRPRRRTQAVQMEEKGLLPLALAIRHRQLGEMSLLEAAQQYVSEPNGLPTPEKALEGALIILSEAIAHDPATRARFRDELSRGVLRARPTAPDQGNAARYQEFFDFAEPIHRIGSGRMLALRRAEREGILTLELGLPDGRHREILRELHGQDLVEGTPLREFYDFVFDHAYATLQEACGRDVRRRIKEKADRDAVRAFGRNLRAQLLSPALGPKKVLSLRTSSKSIWAALVAEDGSVAEHKTLPVDTDEQRKGALDWLCELIRNQQPAAIALPHGRRQAGAERAVAELRTALGDTPLPMVVPVDEAASAIHATGTEGRKALPGIEVGLRAAISLGRRLQDPLQELVRMDVRVLGLGQGVDEVHQGMLRRELDLVTGSCIAAIGCDLNTATAAQLALLPGISHDLAQAIVEHRRKIGGFQSRTALADVPGCDGNTLRHIAGFLLVQGGTEPLDATMVHPEDYDLARAIANKRGVAVTALFGADLRDVDPAAFTGPDIERNRVIAVLQALRQAGRDPRGELIASSNAGVHSFADLRPDQELKGRVANLTEFGAFVDLGIGHDGLVHISQIPPARLRDPQQMLRVGEVITVWVQHTDQSTRKISLTMWKPRHLQEGRSATLGERMEQQQGRRPRRERTERGPRPEPKPVFSRAARAPESRRGRDRRPPVTPDGKPVRARVGENAPEADREHQGGRGRFDRADRGPRRGGGQESRTYTIDSDKEVADARTHKGEVKSLAGLRALLGSGRQPAPPTDDS